MPARKEIARIVATAVIAIIGWDKAALNPGESKTVALVIDPSYMSIFDFAAGRWTRSQLNTRYWWSVVRSNAAHHTASLKESGL